MITTKGRKVTFTGKDFEWLKRESKALGLDHQTFFTAVMWESVLNFLRKERYDRANASR